MVKPNARLLAAVSHPGVTKESLEELLNGENCTLYGNASSVRKYFEDGLFSATLHPDDTIWLRYGGERQRRTGSTGAGLLSSRPAASARCA